MYNSPKNNIAEMKEFKQGIEELVEERKAKYCKKDGNIDVDEIKSTFNREKETTEGYNGRQLLELIQNADDAKSDEMLIELDTTKQTLIIDNKGNSCDSFSIDGIKSLLLANLSSKNRNDYIGNKGLGFRSIINWSDKITINSNNLDIIFSQDIANKAFKGSGFAKTELPVLAIPELKENTQEKWKTRISIGYKNNFLDDIKEQIEHLKPEILLFLNHLKSINIDIDGEKQDISKPDIWTIKTEKSEFPNNLLEKDDKNSKYELKIAFNDELTNNDSEYLFSYFPTNIKIDMPFIVHGTFDLDPTRNQLIDTHKNRFILSELVALIVKTAKGLTEDAPNYKALIFLNYHHKNEVLEKLGFYTAIDSAVKELEIYPCLDGKYRKKEAIVYSDYLSRFIKDNKFSNDIPYLLIPASDVEINFLDKSELNGFQRCNKIGLRNVNKNIKDIGVRVEFIGILIKNEYSQRMPVLTNDAGSIIDSNEDIYAPSNEKISLPYYTHIEFVNKNLYEKLPEKTVLGNIARIKPYNATEILIKIITSTNQELENNPDKVSVIKTMVTYLYKNYNPNSTISDQNIQLLDAKQQPQNAKDLYLSKTYPSGELTFELFGDVFADDNFLADIDAFNLGDNKKDIEVFFLSLGVDENTKYSDKNLYTYSHYIRHMQTTSISDGDVHISEHKQKEIANFDDIKQKISSEKFILWCIKCNIVQRLEKIYLCCEGPRGGDRLGIGAANYLSFQLRECKFFTDYLISDNKKINQLVNNNPVDFENELFKKYRINKADIESLLLKIGAVDKFTKLSSSKFNEILKKLPEKDPNGKLAQKIYIEIFKNKEFRLDEETTLFAQKGDQASYFNKDQVYYSGVKKLPKNYIKTKAIFDYPKKIDTEEIIEFFGVNNLADTNINIKDKILSDAEDDFQEYFTKIKPYILSYRLEKTENEETKDDEAKKIKDINILLCSVITCEIDNEEYELLDYDYLVDDEDYLIKVPNKKLDEIREDYHFYNTFGNIIGILFGLKDTDKFQNCIKDKEYNIKQHIEENISRDSIDDAKHLLGINTNFYNFWNSIYASLGREYTNQHNITLITQELRIEGLEIDVDCDLSNKDNEENIIRLFNYLNITINDFNRYSKQDIDLSQYHQSKLEDCFNNNEHNFKKCLHTNLSDQNNQEQYLTKFNQHKAPKTNYITELVIEYEQECEKFIKEKFNFELCNIDNYVDIDKIYKENKEKFGDIYLRDEMESLLYFTNNGERIRQRIKECEQNKAKQNIKKTNYEKEHPENNQRPMEPANFSEPPSQDSQRLNTSSGRYNPDTDRQQRKIGKESEQAVYEYLVSEYGKENVEWVSIRDDAVGYDIKYTDGENEKWWYVEVKTLSNNVFFISKEEKNFAEKNKNTYKIFLVSNSGDIKFIHPVNFYDNEKFTVEAEKFSVRYKLITSPN